MKLLQSTVLAAVAASALLSAAAAPADAFTLGSPAATTYDASPNIDHVWWDRWGNWHPNRPRWPAGRPWPLRGRRLGLRAIVAGTMAGAGASAAGDLKALPGAGTLLRVFLTCSGPAVLLWDFASATRAGCEPGAKPCPPSTIVSPRLASLCRRPPRRSPITSARSRPGRWSSSPGQLPFGPDGKLAPAHIGKLKPGAPIEAAKEAARLAAINVLAQVKAVVGDLDRVARVIRLGGFFSRRGRPRGVAGGDERRLRPRRRSFRRPRPPRAHHGRRRASAARRHLRNRGNVRDRALSTGWLVARPIAHRGWHGARAGRKTRSPPREAAARRRVRHRMRHPGAAPTARRSCSTTPRSTG